MAQSEMNVIFLNFINLCRLRDGYTQGRVLDYDLKVPSSVGKKPSNR